MPSVAPQKRPSPGTVVVACSAAAAACIALTQGSEGFVSKAKPDPVGIPTGCFGETEDIDLGRIYSRDECVVKLRRRLATSYAPKIAACLPAVTEERRVNVFAALLDAAYNAGPVTVCNSRMARSIRADDWSAGCNGFYGWFTTARDRRTGRRVQFKGLVVRREKEAALCRSGL